MREFWCVDVVAFEIERLMDVDAWRLCRLNLLLIITGVYS